MVHDKFPGFRTVLRQIGIALLLDWEITMNIASLIGDHLPEEVIRGHSFSLKGAEKSDPIAEICTAFSEPLVSPGDCSSSSASGHRNDPSIISNEQGMSMQKVTSDANMQEITTMSDPINHSLGHYLPNHEENGFQNPHGWIPNIGDTENLWSHGVGLYNSPVITAECIPFTHIDNKNVWDHQSWQALLHAAEAMPTLPVTPKSENLRQKHVTINSRSTEGHIRHLESDVHFSPNSNPQGKGEVAADYHQDGLKHEELSADGLTDFSFPGMRKHKEREHRTDDVWYKAQSGLKLQHHPVSLPAGAFSPDPGVDTKFPKNLRSKEESYFSDYSQQSRKRKATESVVKTGVAGKKSWRLSWTKDILRKNSADRFFNEQIELKTYKEILKTVTDEPVQLLSNGNFMSNEVLKYILNADTMLYPDLHQQQEALKKYLKSYKSCYRPTEQTQGMTSQESKIQIRTRVSNFDRRMNSNVHYFLGRNRFTNTDLGHLVEQFEEKWLHHLVESYPGNPGSGWKYLWSWYELVKRSTICLLYQTDLLYRISITMNHALDQALEIEKESQLKKIVLMLDGLWMSFPFWHEDHSSQVLSPELVALIKISQEDKACFPPAVRVSRIFLSNWLMERNFSMFEKIMEKDRLVSKLKIESLW